MSFESELKFLINRCSKENGSDTPDYILAKYLNGCLDTYNEALVERERWYGRKVSKERKSEVFIQYKGTDLCADLTCVCGDVSLICTDHCYNVQCPSCKRVYKMPTKLIGIPLVEKDKIKGETIRVAELGGECDGE